eukprot:GHRQ01012241.1.p1 GENE.GHRQ01012241.1~~GHRQ01012241.1.p1  ORF type:complete len:151 (-),score=23.17 GHRQ01012241.1:1218-1670(-)
MAYMPSTSAMSVVNSLWCFKCTASWHVSRPRLPHTLLVRLRPCICAILQVFADYKTRGPVILKPSDTAELIEKLEDSQMQLGSMATNRWGCGMQHTVGACSHCCVPVGAGGCCTVLLQLKQAETVSISCASNLLGHSAAHLHLHLPPSSA